MRDIHLTSHTLLNELVTMSEAAWTAYLSTTGTYPTISDEQRCGMAQSLSQMLTLYALSEDRRSVEVVNADELEGCFTEGGSVLSFSDGREPIRGIAVTRISLKVAIDTMNRRSDTPAARPHAEKAA